MVIHKKSTLATLYTISAYLSYWLVVRIMAGPIEFAANWKSPFLQIYILSIIAALSMVYLFWANQWKLRYFLALSTLLGALLLQTKVFWSPVQMSIWPSFLAVHVAQWLSINVLSYIVLQSADHLAVKQRWWHKQVDS